MLAHTVFNFLMIGGGDRATDQGVGPMEATRPITPGPSSSARFHYSFLGNLVTPRDLSTGIDFYLLSFYRVMLDLVEASASS